MKTFRAMKAILKWKGLTSAAATEEDPEESIVRVGRRRRHSNEDESLNTTSEENKSKGIPSKRSRDESSNLSTLAKLCISEAKSAHESQAQGECRRKFNLVNSHGR